MKNTLLYMEIYQILKSKILASPQIYKLPSERVLAQQFHVSRITIRHAIKLLLEDNIIEKKARSASFIKNSVYKHDLLHVKSLKEEFSDIGVSYHIDILSFEIRPVTEPLAYSLKINTSDLVYFIERIIFVDQQPLIYEISYMPHSLFPNMKESDMIVKYDYIEKDMEFQLKCVHKSISANTPSDIIKKHLQVTNQAVLLIDMYAELSNGIICDYVQQYYHPKHTFSISSYRS